MRTTRRRFFCNPKVTDLFDTCFLTRNGYITAIPRCGYIMSWFNLPILTIGLLSHGFDCFLMHIGIFMLAVSCPHVVCTQIEASTSKNVSVYHFRLLGPTSSRMCELLEYLITDWLPRVDKRFAYFLLCKSSYATF